MTTQAVNFNDADDVAEYKRFVTYRLSQINAKLSAQASRLLRDHCGLSIVQWRILALIKASAPITSTTLVRAVAMDPGLFSRNLKSLIADGLVLSNVDHNDQRQYRLQLSKRGLHRYKQAAPIMKRRRQRLTMDLSTDELEIFHRVLDKLEERVSEDDQ